MRIHAYNVSNIFEVERLKHLQVHMQDSFTSHDVIRLTGITARQLQWWDERRIVVPARQGHRRIYSFEDLTEVAVICELRRKGFSLQRVRKVVRFLQKEFSKRLAETVSGSSNYHLLTDGHSLYLETSPQQIVDILKNSRQPMLAICLSDTVRQVKAIISGRKRPGRCAPQKSRSIRKAKLGS
jgi:DNA-binding transcriptional MerR regulator